MIPPQRHKAHRDDLRSSSSRDSAWRFLRGHWQSSARQLAINEMFIWLWAMSRTGLLVGYRNCILFQKPMEILFCYAQLIEDFLEQPASYVPIAMYWNGSCSAVGTLPPGVASLLPHHFKSQVPGDLLQILSFGRHGQPLHQHLQEAFALLLRAPLLSCRIH
jgi:hypothetical protein